MDNKKVVVNNFPLFGIMGLIFITLKLTGYITWSWWWVTAPFWGPFAFVICLAGFFFIGGVFLFLGAWFIDKINKKVN
jgi:hypothetical protein